MGLLLATVWAISPRLEEGWPFHLPGYCGLAGNSAQPFRGGYAYKPTPSSSEIRDSFRVFSWDGREIPPWPQGALTTGNYFAPCLGDINGDGGLDIVYRGNLGSAGPCRIEAIDLQSGNYLPGWPISRGGGKGWGPVNLWDMDGDGLPEVVATEDTLVGAKHYVIAHMFDGDGSELPGWPVVFPGWLSFQTTPAVGDPDADGMGEVVFPAGDSVTMLDATGTVEPGWPFPLGQGLPPSWVERGGSPKLVDLDLDGTQEIILFTHIEDTSGDTLHPFPDTTRVFVFNHDGTLLPGSPWILHSVGDYYKLGDADGDGIPEVILPYAGGSVLFLDPYGNIKGAFQRPPRLHLINPGYNGTADTDGDGRAEIVFSGVQFIPATMSTKGDTMVSVELRRAGVVAFDLAGKVVWELRLNRVHPPESLMSPGAFATSCTVTFGDPDGDGFLEFSHDLVEQLGHGCNYVFDSWLYIWELPGITNWRIDWSGPSHDQWNTNNYDFWPENPPLVKEASGKNEDFAISVFPNPGRGRLKVSLMVPSSLPVIVKAYDPAGRMVLSQDMGVVGPGVQTLEMLLGPGIYFLKAEAGSWAGMTKGAVVR